MFYYQLKNELVKLFAKKRTYIGFGVCLVLESFILLAFRYTNGMMRALSVQLEHLGYDPKDYITNLTISTILILLIAYLLMPIYVALVGGDLVAKEAEEGSLRMILSRPISRTRLVGIKWIAGAIFAFCLAMVLGLYAVGLSSCLFPNGGLFAHFPEDQSVCVFANGEGWVRYLLAITLLSLKGITVMGIAWMFSCCNMKPAAATILALSIVLTFRILQDIPYFHDWHEWFLTYHLDFWMKVFHQPVPRWQMLQSLSVLFGFNVTFFVIGASIFHARDIKS